MKNLASAITLFESTNCPLNKTFRLVDGDVVKTSGGNMVKGVFTTHSVSDAEGLNDFLDNLNPNQAVSIGVCNKSDSGRIKAKRSTVNNAISRTLDNFDFSNVLIFDVDDSTLNLNEVIAKLSEVDPNLNHAKLLVRPSSSHGVHKDGSAPKSGPRGYHVWVLAVKEPSDILRYGNVFAKRCWLKGMGSIKVSKSGGMLVRQLVDAAVFSPERLVFSAAPTLGDGVIQSERAYVVQNGGEEFDTSKLHSLTDTEEATYESLVYQAKEAAKPQANSVKKEYVDAEVDVLIERGVDEKQARYQVTLSLETSQLYGYQLLHFREHGTVAVADVLNSPEKFDGCTLADPLEPEYHGNDMSVAMYYANKSTIHSFAHGGNNYFLRESPLAVSTKEALQQKVRSAIDNKLLHTGNPAQWIVDNVSELDAVGEDLLITIVAKSLDLGRVKIALKNSISTIKQSIQSEEAKSYRAAPLKVQHNLSLPLDKMVFPDIDLSSSSLLTTKSNFVALLKGYGITLHYDLVAKKQYLEVGDGAFCDDLAGNAKLAEIQSLCGLNSLPFKSMDYLSPLFAVNAINPVTDYIKAIKWDGNDHISILQNMVSVTKESKPLWDVALRRWLIQCVAAADGAENTTNKDAKAKYEHCLVLTGEQGVKKTTFFGNLIPSALKPYFADGMHLEPANKDSVKLVITNWIVELGEIDATFQRGDISRIKAFLSKPSDKMRMPYDKVESHFRRRTSFCGSVNDTKFLTDKTGSRRYWVVETLTLPTLSEIEQVADIDQMWAQAWHLYRSGEIWWADNEMKTLVDASGERHATDDAVLDALEDEFDLENSIRGQGEFVAAGSLPERLGMQKSNQVSRNIRQALKSKNIERLKNNVHGYWLISHPYIQ